VNVDEFRQEDPGVRPENWQVAYDDRFLDGEGTSFISERWATSWRPLDPAAAEPARSRLIFFIHFLRFDRPLGTPYGLVDLPPPSSMPERLARILAYEPPD
jgi:hypothetical protein